MGGAFLSEGFRTTYRGKGRKIVIYMSDAMGEEMR